MNSTKNAHLVCDLSRFQNIAGSRTGRFSSIDENSSNNPKEITRSFINKPETHGSIVNFAARVYEETTPLDLLTWLEDEMQQLLSMIRLNTPIAATIQGKAVDAMIVLSLIAFRTGLEVDLKDEGFYTWELLQGPHTGYIQYRGMPQHIRDGLLNLTQSTNVKIALLRQSLELHTRHENYVFNAWAGLKQVISIAGSPLQAAFDIQLTKLRHKLNVPQIP